MTLMGAVVYRLMGHQRRALTMVLVSTPLLTTPLGWLKLAIHLRIHLAAGQHMCRLLLQLIGRQHALRTVMERTANSALTPSE
jgi:hypothetical protein